MKEDLRLYDNTRIECFRRCPRKYFYRHVLHWEPITTRSALAFGAAWHAAQEVIWPGIIAGDAKKDIIQGAFLAFVDRWCKEGQPHPREIGYELEKEMAPRTPAIGLEMISAYVDERHHRICDMELVSCEKPFIVPLDPDDDTLFYVGKIDKVVRPKKIRGIEHKTTSLYKKSDHSHGRFRDLFIDQFSPNSQVDGYLYALHMIYGHDAVEGIWVDAALVHRTETGFLFIPIEKRKEQLDMWLWETRFWIDQIEANTAHLEELSPSDPYMAAFPKQTSSCTDYQSTCEYIGPCRMWANPGGRPAPDGFRVHKWDPLEHIAAGPLLPND